VGKLAKPKAKAEQLQDKEISTSDLAAVVGKTPQWIRQLTRDKILKQVGRGKYLLCESVQAYIEHAAGGKEEDNRPKLRDEQAEWTRIKKEDAMLDLAVKRGELHNAEDVRTVVTDMLLNFRSRMLALPTKIGPKVAYLKEIPAINAVLEEEIRIALTTLSDYKPEDYKEGASNEQEPAENA
jgi:phage terminase Nu1 subunit (DNA packaging protein)